jgi:hypothetical protein
MIVTRGKRIIQDEGKTGSNWEMEKQNKLRSLGGNNRLQSSHSNLNI